MVDSRFEPWQSGFRLWTQSPDEGYIKEGILLSGYIDINVIRYNCVIIR